MCFVTDSLFLMLIQNYEDAELKLICNKILCMVIAERIEDFTSRKNIVTRGRDIVKVLKALIICGDKRDLIQNVYYFGLTEEQVLTIFLFAPLQSMSVMCSEFVIIFFKFNFKTLLCLQKLLENGF